jgi:hypothetical protein
MKKIILLLSIFFTFNAHAQGSFFLEQKVCDSAKWVIYTDLVQRSDGSFFVCGYNSVNAIYQVPFLIKLDANYQEVMRREYRGTINREDLFWELELLPNGNLLVMGNLESKDGDFAGLDTNSLSCGRILVAEMDTMGNFVRTKTYPYCGQTKPTDMALDKQGNIYVCGHTISQLFDFSANPEGGMETNTFLIRLDTAFNGKWLEIFDAPGSQDIEPHICVNSNDEVLFTTSSIDKGGYFAATSPTTTGMIYLSCIDSNRVLKWQKCYGSISNGIGTNFVEATSQILTDTITGNIYIIGFASSKDGDMYEILDQNPLIWSFSSYILKLDSLGNKLWGHRYGAFSASNPTIKGPWAVAFRGAAALKGEELYLLSEVLYSDSVWTGTAQNNDQQPDQWLIKLDSAGLIKNKLRIGGAEGERFAWLKVNNKNGNPIIAMQSGGTICLSGATKGSYIIYESGTWPTAIQELVPAQEHVKLLPNPANTICTLVFEEPTSEAYTLLLYDMNGKRISKEKIKPFTLNHPILIQDLNPGVYLVQLKSKSNNIVLRLIKS